MQTIISVKDWRNYSFYFFWDKEKSLCKEIKRP